MPLFPTTGILDNFNRADVGPPPSASWTSKILASDNAALKVISNQCGSSGAGSNQTAHWSAATFGPDVEVHVVLAALTTTGNFYSGVFARVTSPVSGAADAYAFFAVDDDSAEFYRVDNDTYTQLGATITQAWTAGDSLGLEITASTLTGRRKTGGTWASVGTRSDATYSGAGYIGIYTDGNTIRLDDFGGGTVVTSVSETPTPGGATAGGSAPVARATAPTGGALAAGVAATVTASAVPGGAAAAGAAPSSAASALPGGALVSGVAPSARADATSGGAAAAGNAASARADVAPGGATATGRAPTDTPTVTETPTPGGATGNGNAPAPRVDVPPASTLGAGTAPTARTTASPGGLVGEGNAPTARAGATAGGAAGGGTDPGQRASDTVTPGGAAAGGTSPSPWVTVTVGGAIAAANTLTGAVVYITPGGATAAGVAPSDGSEIPEVGHLLTLEAVLAAAAIRADLAAAPRRAALTAAAVRADLEA